jgi:hypothetical protein
MLPAIRIFTALLVLLGSHRLAFLFVRTLYPAASLPQPTGTAVAAICGLILIGLLFATAACISLLVVAIAEDFR